MPYLFGKNIKKEKIKFLEFRCFLRRILIGQNKKKSIIKKVFSTWFFIFACFLFFSHSAFAADRYWVGDTGNWSDIAHWSDADGGTGGQTVPTSSDNVFFSAGSLSTNGAIITLNAVASTSNLDFSGLDQTMTLTSSVNALNVYGSLSLSTNLSVAFTSTAYLNFKSTSTGNTEEVEDIFIPETSDENIFPPLQTERFSVKKKDNIITPKPTSPSNMIPSEITNENETRVTPTEKSPTKQKQSTTEVENGNKDNKTDKKENNKIIELILIIASVFVVSGGITYFILFRKLRKSKKTIEKISEEIPKEKLSRRKI